MMETIPGPEPELKPKPAASPASWQDVLLLIFSAIAMLILLGRGVYLVIRGFIDAGLPSTASRVEAAYGAASMLFCALLLLPVLILSLRRLRGRLLIPARVPAVKIWQIAVLLVLWVIVLSVGALTIHITSVGWIVGAPLLVLGIAIPIAGILWIALGGLATGSWRRLWASLGLGMTVSTSIAIGLELLTAGLALVVAGVIAAVNPALRATLEQLRAQVANAGNVQDLMPVLTPYLNNPLVILVILFFVSGVGPLIEEAFKPLAVWLVGKHLRSTAEGFALGALCGAGFAILEGLLVSSGAADMAGVSVAARATSSLMHITASALMGWAIASAILEKKYLRLFLTYLASFAIHGLWNGAVVLSVYGGLRVSTRGSNFDILGGLSTAAGLGLVGILVVAILIALPLINYRLRKTQPIPDDIITPNIS